MSDAIRKRHSCGDVSVNEAGAVIMDERDRYEAALQYIAKIGCMQSKDEEESFCKHDGSAHSCYCPEGIARRALRGEQWES